MFVKRSDSQKWGLSEGQLPLPALAVHAITPPSDSCLKPTSPVYECCAAQSHWGCSLRLNTQG